MITEPGIYEIPDQEYHADPCPAPSLSASLANKLLSCSPWHAWHEHPRLNPDFQRDDEPKFDRGRAAHALILEGQYGFAIVEADDWRTKAAREARDAARLAGKTPLLAKHWGEVQLMADAVTRQLADFRDPPRPLSDGLPERTLVWREGSIWCRARLDWLRDDQTYIDDLKTTAATANPEQWTRTLYGIGADVQVAWYLRGLKALTGCDAEFRFVVVENYAPFALSVVSLSPPALVVGQKKVMRALELWEQCLETGNWPGYPQRVCYADLPPWEEARWMAREMREMDEQPPDRLNSLMGAAAMGGRIS